MVASGHGDWPRLQGECEMERGERQGRAWRVSREARGSSVSAFGEVGVPRHAAEEVGCLAAWRTHGHMVEQVAGVDEATLGSVF